MSPAAIWYKPFEVHGITASVIASFISFVSVVTLLSLLAWVTITGRRRTHKPFMKTHIGAYFLSLMLTDLMQTIGGIMGVGWVQAHHIYAGRLCTAQAAIKQFSNVSAATWSAVIAIHTLRVLLFNSHTSNTLCFTTLVLTWSVIVMVVIIGPAALQTNTRGSFYGVTGYWCWITNEYSMTQRFFLQWFFMFTSALISIVVYTMVFFRLRGNLIAEGWRLRILRVPSSQAWNLEAGRAVMEVDTMKIAWQLMWYPLAYTLSIVPMASARWASYFGHKVPAAAMMTASVILMLSGCVNTIMFLTTRRVFPPIRLRRKTTTTPHPDMNMSINRFADPTQRASCAKDNSTWSLALPLPQSAYLGVPELVDYSRTLSSVERGDRRMSGDSMRLSTTGTSKSG